MGHLPWDNRPQMEISVFLSGMPETKLFPELKLQRVFDLKPRWHWVWALQRGGTVKKA
jgi:hypothetical protein